jgi:hypothetical protein
MQMRSPHASEALVQQPCSNPSKSPEPLSESSKIRRDILVLIEGVRNGDVEPRIANAIAVLANVALGSLRLDMKIRELEDLEARITDLEEITKQERPR